MKVSPEGVLVFGRMAMKVSPEGGLVFGQMAMKVSPEEPSPAGWASGEIVHGWPGTSFQSDSGRFLPLSAHCDIPLISWHCRLMVSAPVCKRPPNVQRRGPLYARSCKHVAALLAYRKKMPHSCIHTLSAVWRKEESIWKNPPIIFILFLYHK